MWQYYLPRLSFQQRFGGMPDYPVYDVWLKGGWAAFGWLEVKFPERGLRAARAARRWRSWRAPWSRSCAPGRASTCALAAAFALAVVTLFAGLHWTEFRTLIGGSGPVHAGPLPAAADRADGRGRRGGGVRAAGAPAAGRGGARCWVGSPCSSWRRWASWWGGSMRDARRPPLIAFAAVFVLGVAGLLAGRRARRAPARVHAGGAADAGRGGAAAGRHRVPGADRRARGRGSVEFPGGHLRRARARRSRSRSAPPAGSRRPRDSVPAGYRRQRDRHGVSGRNRAGTADRASASATPGAGRSRSTAARRRRRGRAHWSRRARREHRPDARVRAGEPRSMLSALPDAFERAALFQPGVGEHRRCCGLLAVLLVTALPAALLLALRGSLAVSPLGWGRTRPPERLGFRRSKRAAMGSACASSSTRSC